MAAVSLKDIANEVGVSESLVSKVLSGRMGKTGASPALRKAIRAKAKEMGYRRNRTASALASGRHGVLAVYVHTHGEPGSNIAEEMTKGVTEAAARQGQRLWLQYFTSRDDFMAKAGDIHAGEVDGLIVAGVAHSDMVRDFIFWQRQGLPVVTIHPKALDEDIPNVGCSDRAIGRIAAEHLVECGCRRLVHVGSEPGRRRGFIDVIKAHKMDLPPELDCATHGYSYHEGTDAWAELSASDVEFDGIFADSDQLALAMQQGAILSGKRIPQELRVCGVDNSPVCELTSTPLSSVSQRSAERGELAVDLVVRMINGETCESVDVEPLLVQRESS